MHCNGQMSTSFRPAPLRPPARWLGNLVETWPLADAGAFRNNCLEQDRKDWSV